MLLDARSKASIHPGGAMPEPSTPRYRVRRAAGAADLAAALALRSARFRGGEPDRDAFDDRCVHVMVEDADGLACTFRAMPIAGGAGIGGSYAAQHYDLAALRRYGAPMVELGRFCARGGAPDADVLRLAWGALGRIVEGCGAGLLFGCSSFDGTEAGVHADAFALLAARHQAPRRWAPTRRAAEALRLAPGAFDGRAAMRGMPPLLRGYLGLGGWVSDHAVVDRDLGRMHVFTGLEIASIPAPRLALLSGLAAAGRNPRVDRPARGA